MAFDCGFRTRRWDTRVGSIALSVPKLRKGSYFPEWLLTALRNLLTCVPRSAQGMVAMLVRSIFAQPDDAAAWAHHGRVVEQLQARFADAAKMLDEALVAWSRSKNSTATR